MEVSGNDTSLLDPHSGGYRLQRVSPTEKRGRTHTSTVTVAIVDPLAYQQQGIYDQISDSNFKSVWFSGTGNGGQKRNKSMLSIRLTHIPTGFTESRQDKSRKQNYESAHAALLERLTQTKRLGIHTNFSLEISAKQGSGMRGDKIITLQFQNDRATHHQTNKTCRVSDFMNGKMDLIW